MEKLSNNFENTLIVDKKENFEEWQDRIVDQIHSIILKSNSLQDYSAHYNNLTSGKNITTNEDINNILIPSIENHKVNKKEQNRLDLYNNTLYNIPLLMAFLYQEMGDKVKPLILVLAEYFSKLSNSNFLEIEWGKLNNKFPNEFIEFANEKKLDGYEKFALGYTYSHRFYEFGGRSWNRKIKNSFSEIFQKSSLFRKGLEEKFNYISGAEEIEYIQDLISISLEKIPNIKEIGYKKWNEYLINGAQSRLDLVKNKIDAIDKNIYDIKIWILRISSTIMYLERYIAGMELDFKDVISDIYNKEKILNKNINNVTKEKVDKLFEVMSMLFTEDKEKLNYFFSNFDNESLSSLLDTQTTLKTLLNDWNSFIDRKTRLEKEENHLEKDFLLIVNEQQQKVSTIIPKSLKKAIKADEYRKEMYEKIENKDYNGLDFLEEEAVTRMMSVVQKFNKETSDNALNDNIVKNFLRNKSFTCFSGAWLLASLLLELGFEEKRILFSFGYESKDKELSGPEVFYKHGFLILQKSSGSFLRIDYGFSLIERSTRLNIVNNFLNNNIIKNFNTGHNYGLAKVNNLKCIQVIDKNSKIFRLKDGLTVGYLSSYAGILFKKGDYENCKKIINLVFALDEQNYESFEILMFIADKENNKDLAIKYANIIIGKIIPDSARAYYILGKYAFMDKDYAKAKMNFVKFTIYKEKTRELEGYMSLDVEEKLNIIKKKEEYQKKNYSEDIMIDYLSDMTIDIIHNKVPDLLSKPYKDLNVDDRTYVIKQFIDYYKDKSLGLEEKNNVVFTYSLLCNLEFKRNTIVGEKMKNGEYSIDFL